MTGSIRPLSGYMESRMRKPQNRNRKEGALLVAPGRSHDFSHVTWSCDYKPAELHRFTIYCTTMHWELAVAFQKLGLLCGL